MRHWPFGDDEPPACGAAAELRPEDVFLLWLLRLPLDADASAAARAILAEAPSRNSETPRQRSLRHLLVELGSDRAAQTGRRWTATSNQAAKRALRARVPA